MEYIFTHICKEGTATEKREGRLFGRYIKKGEPVEATCPGCGETATDAIAPSGHSIARNSGIIADIEAYRSPLDGSMITSRSRHRDHMREHGVIEMGNEYPKDRRQEVEMPRAGNDIAQAMGGR